MFGGWLICQYNEQKSKYNQGTQQYSKVQVHDEHKQQQHPNSNPLSSPIQPTIAKLGSIASRYLGSQRSSHTYLVVLGQILILAFAFIDLIGLLMVFVPSLGLDWICMNRQNQLNIMLNPPRFYTILESRSQHSVIDSFPLVFVLCTMQCKSCLSLFKVNQSGRSHEMTEQTQREQQQQQEEEELVEEIDPGMLQV